MGGLLYYSDLRDTSNRLPAVSDQQTLLLFVYGIYKTKLRTGPRCSYRMELSDALPGQW